jgi:hypothetical protein
MIVKKKSRNLISRQLNTGGLKKTKKKIDINLSEHVKPAT